MRKSPSGERREGDSGKRNLAPWLLETVALSPTLRPSPGPGSPWALGDQVSSSACRLLGEPGQNACVRAAGLGTWPCLSTKQRQDLWLDTPAAKLVQLSHKERWQPGQPESHGRTLPADNEPGWGLRLATSHVRAGSQARLACPITLGCQVQSGQGRGSLD